jgi:iron-sulfur cluster repair protein YtfE (RIC family)
MARTQNGGEPDVIEMLVDDHKRVQKLFRDFEKTDRTDAESVRELVEMTCMELQIHTLLEEELFYPALRSGLSSEETDARLNRAEVEHEVADGIIAKLQELTPDDPMYGAYFEVLGDYVRHHIREEEKTLFPAAANAAGIDLQQLGEDMRQRREELFAEIESGELDEDSADEAQEDSGEEVEEEMSDGDIADHLDETGALEDEPEPLDPRRTRH